MKYTILAVYRKLIVSTIASVQKIEIIPFDNGECRLKIMAKQDGDTCTIDSMGTVLKVRYDKKYVFDVVRETDKLAQLLNTFDGKMDESSVIISELLPVITTSNYKVVITQDYDTDIQRVDLKITLYKTTKKHVEYAVRLEYNTLTEHYHIIPTLIQGNNTLYIQNYTLNGGDSIKQIKRIMQEENTLLERELAKIKQQS